MPTPSHDHAERTHTPHPLTSGLSALGWPAWQRVLVVLPVVAVLWLAVLWANVEVLP